MFSQTLKAGIFLTLFCVLVEFSGYAQAQNIQYPLLVQNDKVTKEEEFSPKIKKQTSHPSKKKKLKENKETTSNEKELTAIQKSSLEILYDKLWDERESEAGQKKMIAAIEDKKNIPQIYEENWKLGRLVYFSVFFGLGDELPKDEKEELLKIGYLASEKALKLEPKKIEGHYWYAVNVGAYGVTHGILSALEMVEVSVKSLDECIKIDPKYHWAGPYRVLGRYYYEAPSIISIGDLKASEIYLKKALELEPDFNVNLMYMGILQMKKGDKQKALEYFNKAKSAKAQDGPYEEKRYHREIEKNIKLAKEE